MNKLKLIQCGVGGFGKGWILHHSSKSPDFDVVAIVDISPAILEEVGTACGIPPERRFTSLEDALAASLGADAVLTVTPPVVHVRHARLAFAHGLHFMTEKPLAGTIEDSLEMLALAQAAGKQLVVSQQYRYRAPMVTLRNQLNSGAIGQLGHGHIDFYIPADFTGTFREKMEYPLLLDMAIHHVDLIRAVTGKNVLRVMAQSFRPAWSWYQHDPGLKMLLELEDGLSFSYSGDWSATGRTTSWNGDWRLQGPDGSLHLDKDRVSIERCKRWSHEPQRIEIPDEPTARDPQSETLHRFAEAIRTGIPAETSGADNLHSISILIAAMESIKLGRPVMVKDIIAQTEPQPVG
ncbi:MAG: Gfo/Idh/MocA family protein [Candidatus Methylacidiphilales bacterium]|nr:Gfo/Idh/MocA family oxidoreductase [Candidatus Methylacidiphilales bacterium]